MLLFMTLPDYCYIEDATASEAIYTKNAAMADIKPNNVVHVNFLPKVADFGLAKISYRVKTCICIDHRETVGYAAPQMFQSVYGPVTHRSDVYN